MDDIDPEFADYARAYEALQAAHGLRGTPHLIDTNGRRTFVLRAGSGTPVLFLHGSPATSAVWLPLVARLDGIAAYVVDRPGHGLSGPIDYADVHDLRAHAVDFVDATLDALGLETVVLAGNSLGGLWAFWYALDRPHRVRAVVQAGLPPGIQSPRLPAIFGALSVRWLARLIARLDPPSAASTRKLFAMMGDDVEAGIVDAITAARRLPTVVGGTEHLIQRFVRFPGRFAHRNLWLDADELARIEQRTLVLWGPRDFLGGRALAHRLGQALPRAELVELGTGHLPWLQDAEGSASAIEAFVQRNAMANGCA
jgi:pimeloyl-ACP methyl ester carboxylesterase